ncbi:MAG: FHA domain-containing protein [Anaerolineae bacterium]
MMQDTRDNNDLLPEPINPDVHPAVLRFSVWDRAETIEVPAMPTMIIGRSTEDETVDIDLTDHHGRLLGVSRRHAVVFLTPTGIGIRDLNSANGTSRNGVPLEQGKAYELQHGDELQFGGLYITVYFA